MICKVFFSFSLFFLVLANDDEFDGFSSFPVEHSIKADGSENYVRRGVITIRSVKSNNAHFSQDAPLSMEQRHQLRALVESEGIYKIRIPYKAPNNPDITNYVYSFTKACALYESALSDILTLNLDQSGNILGVSITPTVPYCKSIEMADNDITNFNTTVEVVQTVSAPTPETQQYIQKLEAEKKQKAEGQQADNRSFLAKYWMYIVPLVLIMMFVSNTEQNQGGGGGGR